jgi:antirestriction protein ArdC
MFDETGASVFRHPRDEALFDPYLDFIRVAKALRLFERGDIILRRIVIALWM